MEREREASKRQKTQNRPERLKAQGKHKFQNKTGAGQRKQNECEKIWESARCLTPEKTHREQALNRIRQAVSRKTPDPEPGFGELFLVELQYISSTFWAIQGIFILALLFAVVKAPRHGGALEDYLQWVSIIAAWMGVAGCTQLGRHFARGMAELEQSCYFNLAQVWALRMAMSGIADIVILALCCGRIAGQAEVSFGAVCLYVLVPFVLANVCCLFFFTALRGGRSRYAQMGLAFVTGILAAVPSAIPGPAYEKAHLWLWGAALVAGIGFYLWQLYRMYGKIKRGEVICWN